MSMKSILSDALDDIYITGSVGVVHRAKEIPQTETPCSVIVDHAPELETVGTDSSGKTARISVRLSEVSSVSVGDVFVGDIEETGDSPEGIWEVIACGKSKSGLQWVADLAKQ